MFIINKTWEAWVKVICSWQLDSLIKGYLPSSVFTHNAKLVHTGSRHQCECTVEKPNSVSVYVNNKYLLEQMTNCLTASFSNQQPYSAVRKVSKTGYPVFCRSVFWMHNVFIQCFTSNWKKPVSVWHFDKSVLYPVPQWTTAVQGYRAITSMIICQQVEAKTSLWRDAMCAMINVCGWKHDTRIPAKARFGRPYGFKRPSRWPYRRNRK